MVTLPRYAMLLDDEMDDRKVDNAIFFQALSQLDARDPLILHEFMESYRDVRIKVVGLSDNLRFHERCDEAPEFEQFSVDLWRDLYIQEDIVQIGFLEDKQPVEGLFIGSTSGRVYVCGQADDFSQQKVHCMSGDLYKLIWRGPQQPIQYKSSCMFEGCYGCFDPFVRHRLFRFKQF